MKLWLADLIEKITQEYKVQPIKLNISLNPKIVRETIAWVKDDILFAKYYPVLRKLKKYEGSVTTEILFYESGQIAQVTSTAPGTMTTQCFDRNGHCIDFADFNDLRD